MFPSDNVLHDEKSSLCDISHDFFFNCDGKIEDVGILCLKELFLRREKPKKKNFLVNRGCPYKAWHGIPRMPSKQATI